MLKCQEAGHWGSPTLGPGLWGQGTGPRQRLLRCGGRGTALTRQHHGQSSVGEPAVWAQCQAGGTGGAPGPNLVEDRRASPGGSLGSACPPSQGNSGIRALWGARLSSLPPCCGRGCPRPAVGLVSLPEATGFRPAPNTHEDRLVSRVLRGQDSGGLQPTLSLPGRQLAPRWAGGQVRPAHPWAWGCCVLWAGPRTPVGHWESGLHRAVGNSRQRQRMWGSPRGLGQDPGRLPHQVQLSKMMASSLTKATLLESQGSLAALDPSALGLRRCGTCGGVGVSEPPSPVLGQGQMLLGRWLQALGFGEPWPRTPHRAACWSRGAVGAAEAALCWGQFLTPEAEAYARAGAI